MRLYEALALRKDIQRRLEQVKSRAARNAVVQEGESPAEDPNDLLAQAAALVAQLEDLIFRINVTNAQTTIENGWTLTRAIARRDALRVHRSVLTTVADAASGDRNEWRRATRSELRDVPQVDVRALRTQADETAQELRLLDAQIQAANFSTDVIEL